jgi:hypothetical protein
VALGPVAGSRGLDLDAAVRVVHRNRPAALADARLELAWVDRASGVVQELPSEAVLREDRLRLATTVPLPPGGPSALRLRLVWREFAWQTELVRAEGDPLALRRPAGP